MARWAPVPAGWEPGDPRERIPAAQVEAEREVIRECAARLLASEQVIAVVTDLNERGIMTATGGIWRRADLPRMLTRPAVAGLLDSNGEILGERADIEPILAREDWDRLRAMIASRRRGRPAGRVHLLSGLVRCGRCGRTLHGFPRRSLTPYPDGSPRREYRCRRDVERPGCGRNHIDAQTAEQAVARAVQRRLGDPRRAERIAAHSAAIFEERNTISAQIARWEEEADALSRKTATWGVKRVDEAMIPILNTITTLQAELAALDEPETVHGAVAASVQEWDDAATAGDLDTLRSLIRRAFPRLTLTPAARRGDHSPERFDWDGTNPTT